MNDNLSNALVSLIEKAVSGLDAATDILSSELPVVVEQLLLWHGLHSGLTTLIAIIFLTVCVVADTYVGKKLWAAGDEDNFYIGYCMFGVFPRIFYGFMASYWITLDWLMILVAPKVWLIEYSMSLAK